MEKRSFSKEGMLAIPHEELLLMKKASIQRIKDKFLWDHIASRTLEEIRRVIE